MSQRARVADKFKKQSAEQLVVMAGAVITGLTNNLFFPAPPVEMKSLQAAADELSAALAARMSGGPTTTAEKNNKQAALVDLLRRLKHYVEDNCNSDLAILLSSGFQPAASTRYRAPLDKPAILSIDFGNRAELVMKVTRVDRARCYEVRAAAVGIDNAPGPWQAAGMFTASRSMRIAGLVPGTTYFFQVRAIGGSTGYSDWSDPVSHMCG